jgi:hypothetical protein
VSSRPFLTLKKKQRVVIEKPVFRIGYLKRYCPKKNDSFIDKNNT